MVGNFVYVLVGFGHEHAVASRSDPRGAYGGTHSIRATVGACGMSLARTLRLNTVRPNVSGTVEYAVLMAVAAGLGLLKLLWLSCTLNAAEFGTYSWLAACLQVFIPLVTCGLLDGLGQRVPRLYGQGHPQRALA